MSEQASAPLRRRLLGELDLRQGETPVPPLGSARADRSEGTDQEVAPLREAVELVEAPGRARPGDREATYRMLMRLHDARGDRARALRSYHACAGTLELGLHVQPSPATRRAYEELLPPRGEPGAGKGPGWWRGSVPTRARPASRPPTAGGCGASPPSRAAGTRPTCSA